MHSNGNWMNDDQRSAVKDAAEQRQRATHTPGPWKLVWSGKEYEVCYDHFGLDQPLPKSLWNARLMAAAPELLAAAEELKAAFMDGCGEATKGPKRTRLVNAGAALDAAIAKAKGGA